MRFDKTNKKYKILPKLKNKAWHSMTSEGTIHFVESLRLHNFSILRNFLGFKDFK